MDTVTPDKPQTPHASVYGALLITTGLLLALIALGEKMQSLALAGTAVTVAGIICAVIGSRQKKRLARTSPEKVNAPAK